MCDSYALAACIASFFVLGAFLRQSACLRLLYLVNYYTYFLLIAFGSARLLSWWSDAEKKSVRECCLLLDVGVTWASRGLMHSHLCYICHEPPTTTAALSLRNYYLLFMVASYWWWAYPTVQVRRPYYCLPAVDSYDEFVILS